MLNDYRSDFENFHTSLAREHYLFHSGQKNALELSTIYDQYSHLFDGDSIARISSELEIARRSETESASLNRLLSFSIEHYMESSVRELTEELSQFEATAIVEINGHRMTFQDAAVAVITERHRESRKAIYSGRLAVIDNSNALRLARIEKLQQTAGLLGYSSYANLFEKLRGLDYAEIIRLCEPLLSSTESAYIARLDDALKSQLGLGIDEAERADAIYLLHLTSFDERFPSR